MNTALRLTAFATVLAASFGAAYGVGKAADPVTAEPAAHTGHGPSAPGTEQPPSGGTAPDSGRTPPGGLQISASGYTLDLKTPRIQADRRAELRFAIRDSSGRQVTAYQREHGKDLHLILASRDLTTYRHLHPHRAADGTWSTPVTLPEAGDYRVFADFTPAAEGATGLTLGADLAVSGAYRPAETPAPARTATVDGYTVALDGRLRPGAGEEVTFTVTKDGREVTDLQPYLGAYGHLVALRSGDLAYLHVHPSGEPGDGTTRPGPDVSFTATAPSEGTYRLFLDFKHDGKVRTAAFTVTAGPAAGEPSEQPATDTEGHQDDGHQH
ncbi:hypothetical protein GCM10027168_50090 [Streptomyces capparidis]